MKKKILNLMLFCLAFILTACGEGKMDIRLGTGDPGGTYYSYSTRLSEILKDDFSFQLRSTVGSEANLRLLQKGFLDAALVQSDALYRAEEVWKNSKNESTAKKRPTSDQLLPLL